MERLFEIFPSLAERRRSKGSQLSGGEQQMLAVARGFCQLNIEVNRKAETGRDYFRCAAFQIRWPAAGTQIHATV
jgi:hypothetical protein